MFESLSESVGVAAPAGPRQPPPPVKPLYDVLHPPELTTPLPL